MKTIGLVGFSLATMLTTAVVLAPDSAEASSRSHSAMGCMLVNSAATGYNTTSGKMDINVAGGIGQIANTDSNTTAGLSIVCPVLSDSNISATAGTAALNVYGYQGPTTGSPGCGDTLGDSFWTASACRAYYNGGSGGANGGKCGTQFSASNPGHLVAQSLNMGGWTGGDARDGYFLEVGLGCEVSGTSNVFWSYELTN